MATLLELSSQWQNPSDVTSILMVIGGDVVQKALAQATGKLYAPVCFSFGWVSYAFIALVNVLGDGRLLPPPDYRVKVFNLKTGYARENKNWVIGRILRDHERWISRRYQQLGGGGIRIAVFEALPTVVHGNPEASNSKPLLGGRILKALGRLFKSNKQPLAKVPFRYSKMHIFGVLVMLVQLAIAAIPIALERDWGIMLVTAGGTLLALVFGALPQWVAEKLPNRQQSHAVFGLASGNGSRDIMVIKGLGHCLDLEEFAAPDTPRNSWLWEKPQFTKAGTDLPKPASHQGVQGEKAAIINRSDSVIRRPSPLRFGIPAGFFITIIACIVQSVLWLLLLITVAALKSHTWYLVAIGGIGMFQNGILAALEQRPEERGLAMKHIETIWTKKVMDGLMDLEVSHNCGESLLQEFFPGRLIPEEEAWWNGDRDAYDDKRSLESHSRFPPRSRFFKHDLRAPGTPSSFSQHKVPVKDSPKDPGPSDNLDSLATQMHPGIRKADFMNSNLRFPKSALRASTGDSLESQSRKGTRGSSVSWSSTDGGYGHDIGRSGSPLERQKPISPQSENRRSGPSTAYDYPMPPIPDVGPSSPEKKPTDDSPWDSNLSPPWS